MPNLRRIFDVTLGSVFVLFGLVLLGGAAWAIHDTGKWSFAGAGILALVVIRAGWSRLFPNAYEPLAIDPDDPLFAAAAARARQEIERLERGLLEGGREAYVKFPAPNRAGGVEHVWALAHSLEGDSFTVTIVNEPLQPLEDGRPRQLVGKAEIDDWMLVASDGTTEGGYSHLAMAKRFRQEKGYLPSSVKKELRSFVDLDLEDP